MARGVGRGLAAGILRGYELGLARIRQEKADERADREQAQRERLTDAQLGAATLQREQTQMQIDRERTIRDADAAVRSAGTVPVTETTRPGVKQGETETVWSVGGQTFASKAAADLEARRQNTPVAVAKRQYAAAVGQGVPEVVERYRNALVATRAESQADLRERAMEALRVGPHALSQFYNETVLDGTTEQLSYTPDGRLQVATYRAGKRVGEPMVMSPDDYKAYHLRQFAANPDSYLEAYDARRREGEQARRFDADLDWRRSHGQQQLAVQRAQVGVSGEQVGIARDRFNLEKRQYDDGLKTPRPVATTVGADGRTLLHFGSPTADGRGITSVPVAGVPAAVYESTQLFGGARPAGTPGAGAPSSPGFDVPDDWVSRMNGMQPTGGR